MARTSWPSPPTRTKRGPVLAAATCDNARWAGVWSSSLTTWPNNEFRLLAMILNTGKVGPVDNFCVSDHASVSRGSYVGNACGWQTNIQVQHSWYSAYSCSLFITSEAFRYGTCSQGITQFYLHTHSFNPQSEWATCLCLPRYRLASTHLPTPEGWMAELAWVAGYVVI